MNARTLVQGRRNVFTTGPAKLDYAIAINAWVADNLMNIIILSLPVIL